MEKNKSLLDGHKCKLFNIMMFTLQEDFKMSRRQKKKAPVVEEQTAIEAVLPTKYIYEDTQCVTGVEPEYEYTG